MMKINQFPKNKFLNFQSAFKKFFSHGPYNPMNYKHKLVSDRKLTTEENYFIIKKQEEFGALPMYNMRQVHPIRQSGPIPAYYGDYTMEDVRKHMWDMRAPYEAVHESTDPEELMRRCPGLTKKEALKITSIGLSPFEELDYAYLVVNNGIDVFYPDNNAYLVRQVVTNSKGEKVECLFPAFEGDEFTYMPFSQKAGYERMDHAWDPVPGEPPVCPVPDYELGVPHSFFEYEMDNRLHMIMCFDQQGIPEEQRPCPLPKNPACSKDYFRPQQDLKEEVEMENPDWYPRDTAYNIYNKNDFRQNKNDFIDQKI